MDDEGESRDALLYKESVVWGRELSLLVSLADWLSGVAVRKEDVLPEALSGEPLVCETEGAEEMGIEAGGVGPRVLSATPESFWLEENVEDTESAGSDVV